MFNNNKTKIHISENFHEYTLDNGIQVLIDKSDAHNSVSIGFYILNGARDESPAETGYSHFCEHMIFKATDTMNKKDIAIEFDNMSGYINAYTTHELVVIYDRIPYYFLEKTIRLIHAIFHKSTFPVDEIELEKNVIVNEIRSEYEDPHEKVHEDFMQNLYPNQPLGLPIIGNEESIKNGTREKLFKFYQEAYGAENLVIILSGRVDIDKTLALLKSLPFRKGVKKKTIENKATFSKPTEITILPSEQVHIITGTSHFKADFATQMKLGLLNTILGESMSSRLFQKLREELGLCYLIYSFFNRYRKENLFGLYMSVMPENLNQAIDSVSTVISDLLKNGITNKELTQAKNQKIGELILNYDILQKRMSKIAYMKIKFGKIYGFQELHDIVSQTKLEELNEIIKKLFVKDKFFTQVLYKKNITYNGWTF